MRNPIAGKNIVIIGSGIGGLSAGIILSLMKYSVKIVEKNPQAGGLMRSYRRKGIECPVGIHYVGALGEDEPLGRMFRYLGIDVDELFFRMGREGIVDRYIFDNFVFDLPLSIDALEQSLRKTCPADSAALDVLMKNLRQIAAQMKDPSFLLNSGDPFQNMDFFQPMGELLDNLKASDRLRMILAVPCQLIGVPFADCPVVFHHMVMAGYLFSSWRLKENGSRMADVFTRRFRELGGDIILKDGVNKILLQDGKVSGVKLSSGRELEADAVVAAVHPKLLLEFLEEKDLRASFRQRIAAFEETDGVITVQISIDAATHEEIPHNIYRLQHGRQGTIEDGVFYQLQRGRTPESNLLSIITRSLYSEWLPWEKTISGKRGAAYEEKKMAIAHDLLTKACEIFGPLKNAQIIDVFTPLTLRDYVNCPEGSCYGVLRSARQLLKIASLMNIPIPGLYLAGQNAMAPGVMGSMLGSFAAAAKIAGLERISREILVDA
jgi:all-trans-retinol 13,14-reductase